MNEKTNSRHNWSGERRWFSDAIGGAWRLARQGMEIPVATDSPLYREVCALAASHMPVLIHKFARCSEDTAAGGISKWADELETFVARVVWPHLVESPARQGRDKAYIVKLMDSIVAIERQKTAVRRADEAIPYTSRFDSSWAI